MARVVIYSEAKKWPKDEVEANYAYLETRGRLWELEQARAIRGDSGPSGAPSSDEVPDGTVDEVLAWVGDDKDRAKKALDAEDEADKPRSTLVETLEAMVEAE